ncbi:hypothetical protein [Yinghuangia seranimata]|uniref:hypothetical protein n=1 Tax=Yinghuangia seranimata TaxID=408067 RepID=UPI00248B2184|nr:hypothetical protein [Yinghuangia seranimata]MDI2131326.1 hypothetical protein [Yinghuangia seranimata]
MDEDESLLRFGLRPVGAHLDEIRALLRERTERERRAQGDGDTVLMKLCCIQLFNSGELDDTLLIWNAKRASFDASCSIDIHLLLGRGLEATKAYLSAHPSSAAAAALDRIREAERHGEFEGFSAEEYSAFWDTYYA